MGEYLPVMTSLIFLEGKQEPNKNPLTDLFDVSKGRDILTWLAVLVFLGRKTRGEQKPAGDVSVCERRWREGVH